MILQSIGKDEILSWVSGLHEDITKEKQNLEQSITQLITEVEDGLNDAIEQTSDRIEDIREKKDLIENAAQIKFESATLSINNIITILNSNYEAVLKSTRKNFIFFFLLFFIVVYLYDYLLEWHSIFLFQIKGIYLIKALLFLGCIFFIVKTFFNFIYCIESDISDLEEKKEQIEAIDTSIHDPEFEFQVLNTKWSYLATTTQALTSFSTTVVKSMPMFSVVFNALTLLAQYRQLVENFRLSLSFFNIPIDRPFFNKLQRIAPAEANAIVSSDLWEKIVVNKIHIYYQEKKPLPRRILLLLYYSYIGRKTTAIYQQILSSDDECDALAKVLIESHLLYSPPKGVSYSIHDIKEMLKRNDDFNISNFNNYMSLAFRELDYVNSYLEFLEKNEIVIPFKLTIASIIQIRDDNLHNIELQIINLVYKTGLEVFSEVEGINSDLIDGFTRASVAIKFHDEFSLRISACQLAASKISASIIVCFHEMQKERSTGEMVTLNEIAKDTDNIKNILSKWDGHGEYIFFLSQLKEGKWYDSSASLLREYLEDAKRSIEKFEKKLENYEILQDVVQSTFQNVKIDTIEKAIDAQVFGAYVIMFKSKKGRLANIVDKLSIRNLDDQNQYARWLFRTPRQQEEVLRNYGTRPKYDYITFSDNTRIGILRKGESFLEFQTKFLHDVKTALRRTGGRFSIGLVLQRITPSKYSFGILDEEELHPNIDLKDLDIAKYIARLAIDHIEVVEQYGVMQFEKNINLLDIINHKNFFEIIKGKGFDLNDKERKILDSNEFTREVIKIVSERLGINNFKSLAIDIHGKRVKKKDVIGVIDSVLNERYHRTPGLKRNANVRSMAIATRFYDSIRQVALLYVK